MASIMQLGLQKIVYKQVFGRIIKVAKGSGVPLKFWVTDRQTDGQMDRGMDGRAQVMRKER